MSARRRGTQARAADWVAGPVLGVSGRAPAQARNRRLRRRRRVRRALMAACGLVLVLLAVTGGGYLYVLYRYHQVHKDTVRGLTDETPTSDNILLIGENCRSCLNGQQANAFGTGAEVGGNRSDVTMVLHLDPATGAASVVSIPRDTFVPIPGTDQANRVDDALDTSPSELVQTVEDDFGIPINHFVALNFDTFQGVVDAIGGIDMDFPDPVTDNYSGLDVGNPGCHHLDGTQALEVVRARHLSYEQDGEWQYDPLGDISRIARDHEFLKVVAESMHGRLGNPLTANAILGSITPDLLVDTGFSLSDMAQLVLDFRSVDPVTVPTTTLSVFEVPGDFSYDGASDYGSVVFPMSPSDQQVIDQGLDITPPAIVPGTTVSVVNGSGGYDQATDVGQALTALGEDVVNVADATQISSDPAETIVYYAPGEQSQAEALMPYLDGNAVMGEQALPAGTDLEVVTGTYLSVTSPATGGTPSGSASTPAAATPGSSSSAGGTTLASGAGPVPAGDVTESTMAYPSFDPTACPAGALVTPVVPVSP